MTGARHYKAEGTRYKILIMPFPLDKSLFLDDYPVCAVRTRAVKKDIIAYQAMRYGFQKPTVARRIPQTVLFDVLAAGEYKPALISLPVTHSFTEKNRPNRCIKGTCLCQEQEMVKCRETIQSKSWSRLCRSTRLERLVVPKILTLNASPCQSGVRMFRDSHRPGLLALRGDCRSCNRYIEKFSYKFKQKKTRRGRSGMIFFRHRFVSSHRSSVDRQPCHKRRAARHKAPPAGWVDHAS